MTRADIVAEVARAIDAEAFQEGRYHGSFQRAWRRRMATDGAERAVSVAFARAADWCAIHTRRQGQFLAEEFRALAHHGAAPTSTHPSATATPQSQPASAARLSADDTE